MSKYPDSATPCLIPALLVGFIPHTIVLPWWINIWCLLMWGYLFLAFKTGRKLPSKWFRLCLTLIAFSLILIKAGRTFDNEAGIGLLCLMASLKPFEINGHRDRMITIFLSYFMVISGLFFSNSIAMTINMVVSVVIITGLLVCINNPQARLRSAMKLSTAITVQAVPLMLVLFFIFPRIHGSLWGVQKRPSAVSGFSTTLSPGSVTGIVKNNAVAFRVEFKNNRPTYNNLYWRGIVFQQFDGQEWRALNNPVKAIRPVSGSRKVAYNAQIEPGASKWLFVLDLPVAPPAGTTLWADNTIALTRHAIKTNRYDFESFLDYNTGPLNDWEKVSLMLPETGNLQSRKRAKELFSQSGSPKEYADRMLQVFEEEMFYYTLNPPLPGKDIIDDFLFNSKKGYCGHYASAFVFMMRAAGVPARIVGGYMGGEMNPFGDYMIIKQSDAHAWAEVWFENRGWVRYDPTAAVAPERVEKGISEALSLDEVPSFITTPGSGFIKRFINNMMLGWDAANYQWDTKIIGYTFSQQKRLLEKFGFNFKSGRSVLLLLCSAAVILALFIFVYNLGLNLKSDKTGDPVLHLYSLFIKKMDKAGIKNQAGIGPVDYAKMAVEKRPDIMTEINGITHLYILLRYGSKQADTTLFEDFRRMVKKFKPGRTKPK